MAFDATRGPRRSRRSAAVDEPELHVLQRVLTPRSGLPADLYLRTDADFAPDVADHSGSVRLCEGATFSTDAYFNSFYLGFWRAFTCVERVALRIKFDGRVRVTVWWRDQLGDARKVASVVAPTQGKVTGEQGCEVVLWPDQQVMGDGARSRAGRLYAEIEGLAPSAIHAVAYVTDTAPVCDVALSIGICTYNREPFLRELLNELVNGAERADASIKRIMVVNQGAPFVSPALAELFRNPLISRVEQRNLGGCGGFNRTIFEAVRDRVGCTHHLLMDDDVRIDARVIGVAASFLSYARHDIVLGGHMLTTSAPTILFEAGAVFDPLWFVKPLGQGTDLVAPDSLDLFNAHVHVDYNGWWFCILPIERMESAGFSPPIFIRGDDMEYGCRMGKLGVPTVPVPGVAVWHELNYSHASDWDQYYDIRNRLILSTLHGDLTAQPGAHIVFGYILECLLTHRYTAARMCMAGVSDFLLGPDRLFAVAPDQRHRRVTQLALSPPQDRIDETEALTHEWGKIVARPDSLRASASAYLVRIMSVLFMPYETGDAELFKFTDVNPLAVGNAAYIVTDARRTVFVRHTPRRRRVAVMLVQAVALTLRFIAMRAKASSRWGERVDDHASREAWERLFKTDDHQHANGVASMRGPNGGKASQS